MLSNSLRRSSDVGAFTRLGAVALDIVVATQHYDISQPTRQKDTCPLSFDARPTFVTRIHITLSRQTYLSLRMHNLSGVPVASLAGLGAFLNFTSRVCNTNMLWPDDHYHHQQYHSHISTCLL